MGKKLTRSYENNKKRKEKWSIGNQRKNRDYPDYGNDLPEYWEESWGPGDVYYDSNSTKRQRPNAGVKKNSRWVK